LIIEELSEVRRPFYQESRGNSEEHILDLEVIIVDLPPITGDHVLRTCTDTMPCSTNNVGCLLAWSSSSSSAGEAAAGVSKKMTEESILSVVGEVAQSLDISEAMSTLVTSSPEREMVRGQQVDAARC
jgi:hypothetical protein